MNIFISSVKLYILGMYISICKKYFDIKIDKCIEKNHSLCDPSLTALSNKCSNLYKRFLEEENELIFKITAKKSEFNK